MAVTAVVLEVHRLHFMAHENVAQLAVGAGLDQLDIELRAEAMEVDPLIINPVRLAVAGEVLGEVF